MQSRNDYRRRNKFEYILEFNTKIGTIMSKTLLTGVIYNENTSFLMLL